MGEGIHPVRQPSSKYVHGRDVRGLVAIWDEANRRAIEVILRYHYEQGITARLNRIKDLFLADLLKT